MTYNPRDQTHIRKAMWHIMRGENHLALAELQHHLDLTETTQCRETPTSPSSETS